MPTNELLEKPRKIVLAVRLLYAVVGVGIIRTILTVIRHADVRSPYFLIIVKLLLYSLSIYLIHETSRGKNWARWSIVVILLLGFPLTILPAFDSITHSPVQSLLVFLQLAMYILALVFLFHKTSSGWFAGRKHTSSPTTN